MKSIGGPGNGQSQNLESNLLKPPEAAAYLRISPRLLWSVSAPRGILPVVRIGRLTFYRLDDLQAFTATRSAVTP